MGSRDHNGGDESTPRSSPGAEPHQIRGTDANEWQVMKMTEIQRQRVDEILSRNGSSNDAMLIGILQEIQREERYLPK